MRSYFKGSQLAQMSDGSYCIIRNLGLVKGGKGLKHHENLLTLSVKGISSKFVQVLLARLPSMRGIAHGPESDRPSRPGPPLLNPSEGGALSS